MAKYVNPPVPGVGPLSAIEDPAVRRAMQPLVDAHNARNGQTDQAFVTKRDLKSEVASLLASLGISTATNEPGAALAPVSKTEVVNLLAKSGYSRAKLQADLSAGVQRIVAGVGSDGRLTVDHAVGHIYLHHKDVVYQGYSAFADASNTRLPAVAVTPAGIAMGYNDIDGNWVSSIAIEASTGDAWFAGTVNALAGNFAEGITIGGTGVTLGELAAGSYTSEQLKDDLATGVEGILAGLGTNYRMALDANGVLFSHKDTRYLTTTTPAPGLTGVAITANGVAMGYNDPVTGEWTNAVAISALGDVTIAGTLKAGSVIEAGATINGTAAGDIAAAATQALIDADTALSAAQDAQADAQAAIDALPDKLSASGASILTGTIEPQDSGGIKVGTLTWNATTGALTGGSGIAITEAGIIGAKNGATKFSINAAGDAVFAGTLSAAGGTFAGALSAASGTFTGNLVGADGTFTGTLSAVDGSFVGDISTYGDATFFGTNSQGSVVVVGGGLRIVDYSGAGIATSNPSVAGRVRAGLFGTASSAVTTSSYNVGVLGNGSGSGKGIGVVGDGTFLGGYFYSSSGTALQCDGALVCGSASFTGSITATGNVTAYGSSDASLKENIEVLPDALAKVRKLRGVSFDWIESFHKDNPGFPSHDVGVIAQEVREVLPEVVAEKLDGTLGVRYEKLVPLLIEAIKELSDKVERLESQA